MNRRLGETAPDFTLKDQDGKEVTMTEQLGEKPLVLVFYPRAGSPICTRQLCSLRDGWAELMQRAKVLGLSYDSVDKIRRFKQEDNLPFTLLSDSAHKVAKLYGVAGLFAAARVTFVIGTDGKIGAVIDSILAAEHARQILDAL